MASLTPLSKGLIALAVVGAMGSAVWHLLLKEQLPALPDLAGLPGLTSGPGAAAPANPAPATTTQAPSPTTAPPPAPAPAAAPARSGGAEPLTAPVSGAGLSSDAHFEAGRQALAGGDFARARPHLEQAVQQGHGGAACLLGEMTLKGQGGLSPDRQRAAELFQLAQARNTICFTAAQ